MSYIRIPKEQADGFRRTISRFESIEPVELSDGSFILPEDVMDRLGDLKTKYTLNNQFSKATYCATIKEYLTSYPRQILEEIKPLLQIGILVERKTTIIGKVGEAIVSGTKMVVSAIKQTLNFLNPFKKS